RGKETVSARGGAGASVADWALHFYPEPAKSSAEGTSLSASRQHCSASRAGSLLPSEGEAGHPASATVRTQ
ncbi:hypothetical protein NDU88_000916, partial [Pleurodeles waltl]